MIKDLARFYAPEATANSTLILGEDEHRHAKVLRLAEDQEVHVVKRNQLDSAGITLVFKLHLNVGA